MKATEMAARKKLGLLDTWQAFKWELIGAAGDCLVEGGTPRLLTRGKRKGLPTWSDSTDINKCVVTEAEKAAVLVEYETETGNCSSCWGAGQEWRGWSAAEGTKRATCRKCSGSGKAVVKP